MNRDTAEKIVKSLLAASAAVNDNLFLVRSEVSAAAYEEYKKRSGQVMAAIYLDLLKPIVKEYPDLDPARGEESGTLNEN